MGLLSLSPVGMHMYSTLGLEGRPNRPTQTETHTCLQVHTQAGPDTPFLTAKPQSKHYNFPIKIMIKKKTYYSPRTPTQLQWSPSLPPDLPGSPCPAALPARTFLPWTSAWLCLSPSVHLCSNVTFSVRHSDRLNSYFHISPASSPSQHYCLSRQYSVKVLSFS